MDLRYTEHEEAFRRELREWLEDAVAGATRRNPRPTTGPRGASRTPAGSGCSSTPAYAGINWPKEYGGRGATPTEHLIYIEESERRARALRGRELRRPAPRRPHAHRRGHARAEGVPPPADPQGRAGLVPGLLRAQRRVRPRQPADARRCATATTTSQRPEDLDELRPCRRLLRDARAHRSRRAEAAGHHLAHRADGLARHRHPPAPRDGRHHRVLRGVPRRRARAGREPGR